MAAKEIYKDIYFILEEKRGRVCVRVACVDDPLCVYARATFEENARFTGHLNSCSIFSRQRSDRITTGGSFTVEAVD